MNTSDFQTLLVTGGARSGKSGYAQRWAEALPGELIFIATAQAYDAEMQDRIARHRDDRGDRWTTVDEPIALPAAILKHSGPGRIVLVDCLTLWASNILLGGGDAEDARASLVEAIGKARGPLVLVTNEVGMGIVPDNALARAFRDLAGQINQAAAAACESAVLMISGIPLTLK